MPARRFGSTSPFYDIDFAGGRVARKPQKPYRPRRTRQKLDAVEALAERWLNADLWGGQDAAVMRAFGQELLDTINKAGEPT